MKTRLTNGTWMAGGLATALLLLWGVSAGDARAVRLRSDPKAVEMLRNAAAAARNTPFEGMQFITAWSRGEATTSLVKVAHYPGEGTYLQPQHTTSDQAPAVFELDDPGQERGGLTGYTPKMLDLLVRNYVIVRSGEGSISGRPTRIVEARRDDGRPVGRFQLDRETGLMLHRELLDDNGPAVNIAAFMDIRIGPPTPALRVPQAVAHAPWGHQLVAAELGMLRRDGWPILGNLPGNLSLFEARRDSDPVLHLGYSDGLSVVSVFVQRGRLDEERFAGWRKVDRGGRTVYERNTVQQRVVWASNGYVYTIVADAPPKTVAAAVGALPHGEAGFWARIGRGMGRLASWANPLG